VFDYCISEPIKEELSMNVLAFGASNSRESINATLAAYAAGLVDNASVELLNIHDYELPIYSVEREKELGQPALAREFFEKIGSSDAIIVSYAEHNGSYTAAFKNLFDWMSRINGKVYQSKPMLMLATSPGSGGAASVLAAASSSAPYFSADLKASISVPNFYANFDVSTNELTNPHIKQELQSAVDLL
jgi:chromate reductase